jgi:hypothetical protein
MLGQILAAFAGAGARARLGKGKRKFRRADQGARRCGGVAPGDLRIGQNGFGGDDAIVVFHLISQRYGRAPENLRILDERDHRRLVRDRAEAPGHGPGGEIVDRDGAVTGDAEAPLETAVGGDRRIRLLLGQIAANGEADFVEARRTNDKFALRRDGDRRRSPGAGASCRIPGRSTGARPV